MSQMINLKDVKTTSDADTPSSSSSYTAPRKFGDYFILILKILVGFIIFCWTTTSNYLNSLHIDTDESYPIFDNKVIPTDNPYATRFDPGSINMSNKVERDSKVKSLVWWWERTQQTSYQVGGLVLHNVFDFFKDKMQNLETEEASTSTTSTNSTTTTLVKFFSFLKWLLFGTVSNILFVLFLFSVILLAIPGYLGGLTAFIPLTYSIHSTIWKLIMQGVILFFTFLWMCFAGWVTLFPVIYAFFYLLYIMFIKQLNDNSSRFGTELMKRMKQLVFIYVLVSVIAAFASNELPNETKTTVAVVCVISLIYVAYKMYQ